MAKRKSGKRTAAGRLSRAGNDPRKAWDYGNDVVQRQRLLFDHASIKGGKAANQVFDGIGQLWALDFLEGHGIDSATLRDKGREYAEMWWGYYPGGAAVANYVPRSRTSQSTTVPPAAKRDLYFARVDLCLERGSFERMALFDLVIDTAQGDGIAHWADAIVKNELLKRGRVPSQMRFATLNDFALLGAAVRGLLALANGTMTKAESLAA